LETIMFIFEYCKAWVCSKLSPPHPVTPEGIVADAAVPQIAVTATGELTVDGAVVCEVKFPDTEQSFKGLMHKQHSADAVSGGTFIVSPIKFKENTEGKNAVAGTISFVFAKTAPKPYEISIGTCVSINRGVSFMYGGVKVKEEFVRLCEMHRSSPVVVLIAPKNEGEV